MNDRHSVQQFGAVFLRIRVVFQQSVGRFQAALGRRRIYRKTIKKLSALPDRDLGELGIPRSYITRLAWETAYGR